MTDKKAFLKRIPIFKNLEGEALARLAEIATEYEFDEGAVLAYQRDVADKFYIVREGRLFARSVGERGIVRDSRSYFAGDSFKDVWLFTAKAHDATVSAATAGRVIIIEQNDFQQLLEDYPEALKALVPDINASDQQIAGLSEEAWAEARKSQIAPETEKVGQATGLMPGELIEYVSRRTPWLAVIRLILPVTLLFLFFPVFFFIIRPGFPLLQGVLPSIVIPLVITIFFGSVILFLYFDWANDYFVITNRHIMHYEFNLSLRHFGSQVTKTPVDQIQSVEVEKPNLVANLLDVGTARITTAAATGIIRFDYINDPGLVRDTLDQVRQRVRELDAGREQAVMREALEDHFGLGAPYERFQEELMGLEAPRPASEGSLLRRIVERYGARVVQGDVITYRKHIFVLLAGSRWPLLTGLLLVTLAIVLLYFQVDLGFFWLVFVLLGFADFLWLTWSVEDWRNDTFQVTDRYVIDIDRSPFGTGESRKQAQLSNIQNINSDRPGLLPTLFNYGNVYIETAGATADITFESVVNPNQVQRDIFERREQFQQRQRVREGAQRRKEYAVLLDVYKQAVEQDRIPQRTPPPRQDG